MITKFLMERGWSILLLVIKLVIIKLSNFNIKDIIQSKDVRKMLNKSGRSVQTMDSHYYKIGQSEIKKISKLNLARFRSYATDSYDCDNYAWNLMSIIRYVYGNIAVGMAFIEYTNGDRHALNFIITPENKVVYFEPQTNKVVRHGGFKVTFMII